MLCNQVALNCKLLNCKPTQVRGMEMTPGEMPKEIAIAVVQPESQSAMSQVRLMRYHEGADKPRLEMAKM